MKDLTMPQINVSLLSYCGQKPEYQKKTILSNMRNKKKPSHILTPVIELRPLW